MRFHSASFSPAIHPTAAACPTFCERRYRSVPCFPGSRCAFTIPRLMTLQSKIENNSAVIGVIGLGYVGLPLMAAFHKAGFPVVGFDVDQSKIDALHRGENYLKHLGKDLVSNMHSGAKFDATTDVMRMGECDVIISCVPTPL